MAPNRSVMREEDEEVEECDVEEPTNQAITAFDGSFKRTQTTKKKDNYIVIPASAAAIDASKPLLLRNRPAEMVSLGANADEKEKFFADLETRCEDNTMASYARVDVTKFGEGLLRGLGWTPGAPVGKTNAGVTDVVALIARPERLGLGARPKPPPEPAQGKGKDGKDKGRKKEEKVYYEAPRDADGKVRHYRTLDEQLKVAKKPFYDGCPVYIIGGPHAGMNGRVLRATSDGASRSVVLPNEEVVRIALHEMEQADDPDVVRRRAAEAKEAKELKRQEREKDARRHERDEEDRKRRERERDRDRDERDRQKKRDRYEDEKDDARKKHKMHVEGEDRASYNNSNSNAMQISSSSHDSHSSSNNAWIRTNIRVKIVSKDFQGGKYYCKAGWIVDVLGQGRCSIMMDDTRALVEGFRASDLESVVPNQGGHVVVVRGEFRGEKGVILEKDSRRDRVQVQLEENFEIVSLAMDDVAQTR